MAKVTKKAKVTRFFNRNPTATIKEAAAATKVSYNTAWAVHKDIQAIADEVIGLPSRKDFDKQLHKDDKVFETSARTFKRVVSDAGATKIELSHPPVLPQTLVQDDKHEPVTSDGSTASYYELPTEAKELQDLISHKNMNAQIGEIFRAAYRYGQSSHSDMLRDARKIKFYVDAEIKRLGG
jgi:hypothetical protein